MRKGSLIIEMLVVMSIIMLISIPLARLSTITIRDIPQSYRTINANTSILNALKYDKKFTSSSNRFILLKKINKPIFYDNLRKEIIVKSINEIIKNF